MQIDQDVLYYEKTSTLLAAIVKSFPEYELSYINLLFYFIMTNLNQCVETALIVSQIWPPPNMKANMN